MHGLPLRPLRWDSLGVGPISIFKAPQAAASVAGGESRWWSWVWLPVDWQQESWVRRLVTKVVFALFLVTTVVRAWMETTGTGASVPLASLGLTAE